VKTERLTFKDLRKVFHTRGAEMLTNANLVKLKVLREWKGHRRVTKRSQKRAEGEQKSSKKVAKEMQKGVEEV
jgi:hypothetical protein